MYAYFACVDVYNLFICVNPRTLSYIFIYGNLKLGYKYMHNVIFCVDVYNLFICVYAYLSANHLLHLFKVRLCTYAHMLYICLMNLKKGSGNYPFLKCNCLLRNQSHMYSIKKPHIKYKSGISFFCCLSFLLYFLVTRKVSPSQWDCNMELHYEITPMEASYV